MNELISKLASLCYQINEGTEHAAFFDFSGHTSSVDVRVSKSKEDYTTKVFEVILVRYHQTEEIKKIIAILEGVLDGSVTFKPVSTKVIPEKVVETYEVLGVNDIG